MGTDKCFMKKAKKIKVNLTERQSTQFEPCSLLNPILVSIGYWVIRWKTSVSGFYNRLPDAWPLVEDRVKFRMHLLVFLFTSATKKDKKPDSKIFLQKGILRISEICYISIYISLDTQALRQHATVIGMFFLTEILIQSSLSNH